MADITPIESRRAMRSAGQVARTDIVHCLLVPLRGATLLLPNTTVAEVAAWQAPEPVADTPDWFLGLLNWREHQVPVVSFESVLGGEPAPPGPASRTAVLNTLNGNARMPYVGILTQGIPQLRVVNESLITPDLEVAVPAPAVACYARLGEAPVMVPDIDDLERRITKLLNL